MISVGNRDANKGLGLGFGGVGGGGGGREMEETELEEGEAYSYNNNNNNIDDYDSSIDPDIALSYIDEKLQHVLGHFQKDFEGGVSAENLGAKFGGYGSFLPAYQRSPVWSHPRTPPKVQNHNVPKSPNMQLENGRRNSAVSAAAPPSLRPGPASSSPALPALKAPSINDSVKEEISITSSHAEEYAARRESINRRNLPDQKTLKVRIKVGSDNLSTQKNAAIYSGLGLDVSPSSSLDDSHSESEGMDREPQDAPLESPTNIIRVMTSFPVPEGLLLSPLPDYLVHLTEKEKLPKDSRSMPFSKAGSDSARSLLNGSDSRKGDGKLTGEKKRKSGEKNDFYVECKSCNGRDSSSGLGALPKKEVDVDTLSCEELVTKTLKLPLLSNSYSTVADTTKGTSRASDTSRAPCKRTMRDAVSSPVKEEPPEPIYAEDTDWDENQKAVLAGKIWEDKKASSADDVRKDGYCKREKTFDLVKPDSNVLMARKALDNELTDPPKQKANQRVTSHELDGMKLPSGKEHQSSSVKKKSKGSQSYGCVASELPKENLRVSSSVSKNKKSAYAENYTIKRETENKLQKDIEKAEDRYREFFGDIESEQEENRMHLSEIHSEDRAKDCEVIHKSASTLHNALKERPSGKKSDKFLTPGTYPKLVPSGTPPPGHGPVSDAPQATTAPVLIEENWVCCDKCQTWRLLPLGTNPDNLPEKWLCSMLNWLPGMNKCSFSEEETTKALIALYQVPGPESQNNLQMNPGGVMSSATLADIRHHRNFGSHAPHGGKKKHGIKEIPSANKDGTTQLSKSMKKNIRASVRCESLNDMGHSPVVSEPDVRQLSKSSDLSAEKHKHKQKEKHKVPDHNSDGGDSRSLKMKSKRDFDRDSSRASKKIKTGSLNFTDGDWIADHGGAPGKGGPSLSNGLPTTSAGKEQCKHNDYSSKDSKSDTKERPQVSAKKLKDKVKDSLDDATTKKRKIKDSHEDQTYASAGNDILAGRNFVEEFSENDYRREKKARVSKSGGKESSLSRGSGKADKKGSHTKNQQVGQDVGSTFSQRSLDGMDNKRDLGPVHTSVAATSSSSKVSGSHKNKSSFHEAKGSPVESVSSSPMRIFNPDKGTSARRNLNGKNESHDTEFFGMGSPRRCSYDEDEGGSDRSGTARKDKSTVVQHGLLESSVLDIQDKDFSHLPDDKARAILPSPEITNRHPANGSADYLCQDSQRPRKPTTLDECHDEDRQTDSRHHANGSRPRKSAKGSSSRSKDKSRSSKSDAVNEVQDHVPSCEIKPRDGRNKFQEKYGVKPEENEKRYVEKKDSAGKLFSESSKRENQSSLGGNGGTDAKVDAICGRDAISTPKQSLLQDCNGERSSKGFNSDKIDHVELVSGKGKSMSLPPSGGAQNDTPVRCPRLAHGSHRGSGSDILAADGCKVDDASKVSKQIRKVDHQNGSQHISSKHPTQNGHRGREVDAPSPARKDSSSQAANNAVKEAKDLKHLADRLKNAGSNLESIGLYFQAALKFLHGASLFESNSSESGRHGEMIQWMHIYSSTAKLCEFCAHEYEKSKDMAAAALAYKCMEVAYMRVVYNSHAGASRDRQELQAALQMAPPGESPSSSASDVDNLNHPTTVDKVALPKGVSSPQVTGNHIIAARNRPPNLMRLLSFTHDINFAMEASRKSRNAFAAANVSLGEGQHREGISSIKRALDFNFQDIEGFLRLVRLAMDAISR